MIQYFIRIESIFDVALGKMLLDEGSFALVSSNILMREILGLDQVSDPHNVHISDLEKREGIILKGDSEAVEKIENILRDKLPDCIIFSHPIQQDAIHIATVIRYIYRKNLAILDLGSDLKGIVFNITTHVGEKLLVQIKELTTNPEKLPVCSTEINLSGKYVILEEGANFVRVSRKIRGNDRRKLHDFGKNVSPSGFGIIIRTSAQYAKEEDVINEINSMIEQWQKTEIEISSNVNNGLLIQGEKVSEIIFANASKTYIDEIRSTIIPTIKNYHHFKAYSITSGFALDFIQNFMEQLSIMEISKTMERMIISRDYPISNHVKAEFNFLDGTQEELILGDLIKNDEVMITSKILNQPLVEEFPNFTVNLEDKMECIFSYGSWTVHYRFYSKENDALIGERLRIITPLDFAYRGRIRAFDLGMNLYKKAQGKTSVSIVDNSVTNMVERGMISKSLDERLGEVLRLAMEALNNSESEILIRVK